MCIRDRIEEAIVENDGWGSNILVSDEREELLDTGGGLLKACLLYTSDAADERSSVDLGGRRIIKKKNNET